MRKTAAVFCLWGASLANGPTHAQSSWFTVIGDDRDGASDTIQVDPESMTSGDIRTLRVRVNRAVTRTSWDKIPYRSYQSLVRFDCVNRSARYISITYFTSPLWKGEASRTSDYTSGTPRPMLFLDVSPNPSARIVRAACAGTEGDKK
ncbi:MAG: surface-adhesin E family protein [Pseudomonadota bacterium]